MSAISLRLKTPSWGIVIMDQRDVNGLGLDRGVVCQRRELMPWFRILGNAVCGGRSRWLDGSRAPTEKHAQRCIDMAVLARVALKQPAELSGPQARIAEVVVHTMSKTRPRDSLLHAPQFYRIRNHRVVLMHRSRRIQEAGAAHASTCGVGPGRDVTVEVAVAGTHDPQATPCCFTHPLPGD